jgi:hypothetical protein
MWKATFQSCNCKCSIAHTTTVINSHFAVRTLSDLGDACMRSTPKMADKPSTDEKGQFICSRAVWLLTLSQCDDDNQSKLLQINCSEEELLWIAYRLNLIQFEKIKTKPGFTVENISTGLICSYHWSRLELFELWKRHGNLAVYCFYKKLKDNVSPLARRFRSYLNNCMEPP